MRLAAAGCHLTYCSNIHPGERWAEVRANLEHHLLPVRDAVGAPGPFGVGLRLSALAAEELATGDALAELRDFLAAHDLYVFTINGFPYGPFHGARVKEGVYLPDWQDERRLAYTDRLAELLAALLPDDPTLDGSVSTSPGAFRPRAAAPGAVARMAAQMRRHVVGLIRLRERTGRTISLAIEPEPCCMLETVAEAVAYWGEHLHAATALTDIAAAAGLSRAGAEDAVQRHLGLCFDACHSSVEFEEPAAALDQLAAAGIPVAKIQVSAGLRLTDPAGRADRLLAPFADDVYLHQVVARTPDGLVRHADLPAALADRAALAADEWRVHFHVPIFLAELGELASTQGHLAEVLRLQRERRVSPHLEVETYTWDVLPAEYRDVPVAEAVGRELRWAREQLVG